MHRTQLCVVARCSAVADEAGRGARAPDAVNDLPGFFVPVISWKMALRLRGAHEEEPKSRFSDEQMVAILREADSSSVAAAAKRNKLSEQTLYAWRKHFGEMAPSDVKRLRALEAENARLKRLLAERDLDVSVLKEINARKW